MRLVRALCAAVAVLAGGPPLRGAGEVECDLLVVGGNESAVAAAVQACRLGVKRVVLVNDADWLGGQFSSEGVGAIDEWTTVNGRRVVFPRSGMYLEVARSIEAANRKKYGTANPGNCFCAWLTVEPAEAARVFEGLVEPHVRAGRLAVERGWEPHAVTRAGNRVTGVRFQKGKQTLTVRAKLTIDASDWGDVIRLGGAKWSAGPDAKARFGEPSAPAEVTEENRREMNPLTWCVTLRGSTKDETIPEPAGYDPKRYFGASKETAKDFGAVGWPKAVLRMNVPAFADTSHKEGPYSPPVNVYTHRRLVDAARLKRPFTDECLFLNWPVQDYPLDHWPKAVADALEATEEGAGRKNLVAMAPAQRRLVFADAKRHSLGLLRHLQAVEPRFRRLRLTDEYGTADRLPPKPYAREGLRLEALAMLREQDLRTPHAEPKWAKAMPADGVFGFQFNIDFHPTRRQFLGDDPARAWATVHTPTRNWSTHTDRGMFPLRGLIPVERDGLLGASKNIGVSSIVSSALRLHGQMMLCGQASGTVAFVALKHGVQPRRVAAAPGWVAEVQRLLVTGVEGPGVLLWPYHDLPPGHPAFAAANLLSVQGVWKPDPDSVFFGPDEAVSAEQWSALRARLPAEVQTQLPDRAPATRAEAVRLSEAAARRAGEPGRSPPDAEPKLAPQGQAHDGGGSGSLDSAAPEFWVRVALGSPLTFVCFFGFLYSLCHLRTFGRPALLAAIGTMLFTGGNVLGIYLSVLPPSAYVESRTSVLLAGVTAEVVKVVAFLLLLLALYSQRLPANTWAGQDRL